MTSSADESVDRGDLDPDEADRLASLIRPAWEEDDGAAEAGAGPATAAAAPVDDALPEVLRVAPAPPGPSDAAPRAAAPSPDVDEVPARPTVPTGSAPPVEAAADRASSARATAIDPIPTVDVGDTLPTDMAPIVADTVPAAPPAPQVVRPVAAQKTRLGIGTSEPPPATGNASGDAEVDEDLISTQARPVASVPPPGVADGAAAVPAADAPRRSPAGPTSQGPIGGRRLARAADEEPIELPISRGSRTLKIGGAVAAALVVAVGVVLFARDDEPTDEARPAVPAAATTTAPEIVPPPLPPEPAETTADPARATPTTEPAATAAPAADPPATAPPAPDPPKPTAPPAAAPKRPAPPPKPPGGGGAKPPPKPPGGGIIRDAPF